MPATISHGEHEITVYSCQDVADIIGSKANTIRQRAGDGIGVKLDGTWLFTSREVEVLRALVQRRPGRPAGPE